MTRNLRIAGVLSAVTIVLAISATQVVGLAGSTSGRLSPERSARPTHPANAAPTAAAPTGVAPSAAAPGATVLANFDGVGSLDSATTNFGAEFEPPDQGLCAGHGFVVEMVNSAYRVFNTKGVTLAGPFNINKAFGEGFKQFTSDPRCYFDASTKTWFADILFINNSSTASRIDIAVNTGNPTGSWTVFHIDTTHSGGPGCPCFGDQPTLGIDSSNLYITTNEFSIKGPQFNGAQIYAVDKKDLISNAATVHVVHYAHLTIGGAKAASVQPALTFGAPGAEYFLSSLDSKGTGDGRIGVWALTNVGLVGTGGTPTLSQLVIRSEHYAVPPPALQKGSASTLDSGDDRMQQTQFIGTEIWGALGTSVKPIGSTSPRAGAAWFRVRPALNGAKLQSATMIAQGYVDSKDGYLLYPAIQADINGKAAMVFSETGSGMFPSAAYAVLANNTTDFGAPVVAAPGTGPYDPTATRWGDYSWAFLDPASDSVWMATEYIPPLSSQTTDKLANWGTRVIQVSMESD